MSKKDCILSTKEQYENYYLSLNFKRQKLYIDIYDKSCNTYTFSLKNNENEINTYSGQLIKFYNTINDGINILIFEIVKKEIIAIISKDIIYAKKVQTIEDVKKINPNNKAIF